MSPYSVRRALENTCVPVGGLPEDKLSTGQGLIQVNKYDILFCFHCFEESIQAVSDLFLLIRAFEYIKMSKNVLNVQYQVKVTQSGTSGRFNSFNCPFK